MSVKKQLLPGLLAITLFTSGFAIAKPMNDGNQRMGQHKQHRATKKLTPDQQKQVKEIMQSHRSELKPLRKQMHDLHKQLRAQYDSDTPSWSEIKPLIMKMNTIQAKTTLLKEEVKFEVFQKTGIKLPPRKHDKKRMAKPKREQKQRQE